MRRTWLWVIEIINKILTQNAYYYYTYYIIRIVKNYHHFAYFSLWTGRFSWNPQYVISLKMILTSVNSIILYICIYVPAKLFQDAQITNLLKTQADQLLHRERCFILRFPSMFHCHTATEGSKCSRTLSMLW